MAKIDIEILQSTYFTFDKPIEYKNLKIYPILVKDWSVFEKCIPILDLEKNNCGDIEILQMSYLKWLLYMTIQDEEFGKYTMPRLFKILNLCFKTSEICFDLHEYDTNKPTFTIDDVELNARDFDYIRKVVLYQNIPNYEDDSNISQDMKEAIAEYNAFKSKNIILPSLEEEIAILSNERGCDEEKIYNMTYRKFKIALNKIIELVDYKIMKTAEVSGMVTFKQPIDHWLYKTKKNKYGDAIADFDSFKNKVEGV